MKTIGITTHYTNSCNYGGCLQAFALCKVLSGLGFDAKQIRYIRKQNGKLNSLSKHIKKGTIIKRIFKYIVHGKNKISGYLYKENKNINCFVNSFSSFRDAIPHTDVIYNEDTISECNLFDYYITGSDQVWHVCSDTYTLDKFYWLKFVTEKRKISYAASIGTISIPERLHSEIQDALSDFSSISVRQKNDKEMLESFIKNKNISWVLDPTLLLKKNEWELCCDTNPYEKEQYIFAYLLGDNDKDRKLVTKIARKLNFKVITIPYLLSEYRRCDKNFGDIRLFNVSPNYWISLVRNAQLVITDSFHCVAFSIIFHKNFYALPRFGQNDKNSINSRIESLLTLLNCENRMIKNYTDDIVNNNDRIDFEEIDCVLNEERKKSMKFLLDALEITK